MKKCSHVEGREGEWRDSRGGGRGGDGGVVKCSHAKLPHTVPSPGKLNLLVRNVLSAMREGNRTQTAC
jgi:hypothetical protein